jgi:hypothetical protein
MSASIFPQSADASAHGLSLMRYLSAMSCTGAGFARDLLSGQALQPRNLLRSAARVAGTSAAWLGGVLPAWREMSNKLAAWELFAYPDAFWRGVVPEAAALPEAVRCVSELDCYSGVWAMEGVAHSYAETALSHGGGHCRNLLTAPGIQALPPHVRVPLHTGAGLALAEVALRSARQSELHSVLNKFWHSCVENAQDGYAPIAFEALGLVAVTLYPHLLAAIERQLPEALTAYFWHGAGRGLYFSGFSFLPCAAPRRRAIEISRRAPGSEVGRRNALAGFAWAMTLVNIRNPEVLENCLRDHAGEIQRDGAFSAGVASALVVWQHAAPDDPFLDLLDRFRPGDPALAPLWDNLIKRPCADARQFFTALRSEDLPAAVFRVPAEDGQVPWAFS